MSPAQVVDVLLNGHRKCLQISEATVHLPARGTKWVAVFTGVQPGKQEWRSTGLTDRGAVLALARRWEEHARKQRRELGILPGKAITMVPRNSSAGAFQPLSQKESLPVEHERTRCAQCREACASLLGVSSNPLPFEVVSKLTP